MKKLLNKNTFYTQKINKSGQNSTSEIYQKSDPHQNQGKTKLQILTYLWAKTYFLSVGFLFAQLWASFNKESPLTWCEMLGKNFFMIKIFKVCSCAIKNENFLQELSRMSMIRQSMDRLNKVLQSYF